MRYHHRKIGLKFLKNKNLVFKRKNRKSGFFADFRRTELKKNKIQNTTFFKGPS